MHPLTEAAIRGSFVNASRRESRDATLPDLADLAWERMDFLGWQDRKRDTTAYVVLSVDGALVGVRFTRTSPSGPRRRALCAWCQDVVVEADVSLYVARRAGAPGRLGNTIGTLICTEFGCNANVRRRPNLSEVGSPDEGDRVRVIERRIAVLQERSTDFVRQVASTG